MVKAQRMSNIPARIVNALAEALIFVFKVLVGILSGFYIGCALWLLMHDLIVLVNVSENIKYLVFSSCSLMVFLFMIGFAGLAIFIKKINTYAWVVIFLISIILNFFTGYLCRNV